VVLYTRGGATNAVWPITGLLREFDPDFEVLIPFRAHSSGTLFALAANKIIMTALAELSPIDPTTANQFNPRNPVNQQAQLGIAVEDVTAYQDFWKSALELNRFRDLSLEQTCIALQPHMASLSAELHPLVGNVHRVYTQIRKLARMLLDHHYGTDDEIITKMSCRMIWSTFARGSLRLRCNLVHLCRALRQAQGGSSPKPPHAR
jgi:hypothetical protein